MLSFHSTSLFFVIYFLLQHSVDRAIGVEAGLGNFAFGGCTCYGTLVLTLTNVGAIGVLTAVSIADDIGEGWQKLLKAEEIESGKINKRKAGCIGEKACFGGRVDVKNLNVTGGVSTTLNLA